MAQNNSFLNIIKAFPPNGFYIEDVFKTFADVWKREINWPKLIKERYTSQTKENQQAFLRTIKQYVELINYGFIQKINQENYKFYEQLIRILDENRFKLCLKPIFYLLRILIGWIIEQMTFQTFLLSMIQLSKPQKQNLSFSQTAAINIAKVILIIFLVTMGSKLMYFLFKTIKKKILEKKYKKRLNPQNNIEIAQELVVVSGQEIRGHN